MTVDEIIKALKKIGFEQIRQKGSHVRLKHPDNRIVTIPVHTGKILGKGLCGYWAEVPALSGCITEGDTVEEVINNLQDAIQGWLEVANNKRMLTKRF